MESAAVELSVIIPAFNEEQTIGHFLDELTRQLRPLIPRLEVLVVDDGSRDSTWSALCSLRPVHPELRALRLSRNFGKDAAVSAGVADARGRLCVVMDGDFEHPIELISAMLETYRTTQANVVDAVKTRAAGERWSSRLLARQFYRLFKFLSGYDLDGHTDFKLFDEQVREKWLELPERNIFFRGMMAWMGFRHASVHFTVPDIEGRSSRWSRPRLIGLAVKSLTSFSAAPLQLVTALGAINLVFAVLLSIQSFYTWWRGGAVEGFTTVILLQLIQGSITMIALGIIGLYLARVAEEVKSRPRFLVSESFDIRTIPEG